MPELPSGTVAFLFTDIEASTRLWQDHAEAMRRASDRHDALLRGAAAPHGGVVYKAVGDALQVAFPTAPAAVAAALEARLCLEFEDWAGLGLPEPLRVRMALHAGDVDPDAGGDYRSPVLNRLGRLLAAGHGGQVLASQAVRQLARDRLPADAALADLGEHRLRDLLEPERVSQLLHPALPDDFPPLKTLDARPHNLPVQPTPFLGREAEVARATDLLRRDDVRLLTLTGPGGTGKTRLGLQVAAELLDDFAAGVFFVGLAPLTNADLVASAIAEAVGVRAAGGRPLPDLLRDALAARRLLLVLDNFEQVAEAAPLVAELLSAGAGPKVLATSRVPLRLRAERELAVPPLPLPPRQPPPTAAQLPQYEAVRLFVERARAVRADFAVDDANAPAVAEVCRRLDGLPLAIELAAARGKVLAPQAMLARLDKRLPLLTGGARDLPARQQTLRGAIAWSHDLLAPGEQALFRRLAVFAGGCTLDAAEAVAGSPASGELELEVLDGLSLLVDHSLLRQVGDAEQEGTTAPRFLMLDTIREYALEAAGGEAAEARQRHAAFFLALAERAEPELTGPEQGAWLTRLETEHDNLRAALAWAVETDPETALRLGGALWRFWWIRGHLTEGRDWLERALARGAAAPVAARAKALDGASGVAWALVDLDRAMVMAEESLALSRTVGEKRGLASALSSVGVVATERGDLPRAFAAFQEELGLRRELGDQRGLGLALGNLGEVERYRGDLPRAAAYYDEALGLLHAAGDSASVAYALTWLGFVTGMRGEARLAAVRFGEALRLRRDLGDRQGTALAMEGVAAVVGPVGRWERAARLFGAAAGVREEVGAPRALFDRAWFDRAETSTRDALGEAAFAAASTAGRLLPLDEAVAEALALADEAAEAGDA